MESTLLSMKNILASALLLRIFLIVYGEWQDRNFELKFTDVDYHVFTDAAEYTWKGYSPYNRPTYRYTPLLAWMLIPCHLLHIAWGKILFVLADMVVAKLIHKVLQMQNVEEKACKIAVCTWLFNPITMAVSSRGNAESVISMTVIGTLYYLQKRRILLCGILFGFSIHLKIYPIVTGLAYFLYLGRDYNEAVTSAPTCQSFIQKLRKYIFSKERMQFCVSAVLCLALLTLIFHGLYGYEFLEHTYLYHITRKDIRHNFSIYFYMLYTNSQWWLGLVCFFNQIIVILFISITRYKSIIFCNFLLIFAFVTFNKVCTSQYFLWYLSLLPLIVPGLKNAKILEVIIAIASWAGAQSLWLAAAYKLEFKGESVFDYVWYASIIFFWVNILIMIWLIERYSPIKAVIQAKQDSKKQQ